MSDETVPNTPTSTLLYKINNTFDTYNINGCATCKVDFAAVSCPDGS